MSKTLQFRRYDSSTVANTVGANGEFIIDTTDYNLTIHDGVTPGGHRLSTYAFTQSAFNAANNVAPQIQPAFNAGNSASSNTIYTQSVDASQNTKIQAAFDKANTSLQSSGGTIAGDITSNNLKRYRAFLLFCDQAIEQFKSLNKNYYSFYVSELSTEDEEEFKKISEAYDTLGDENKRRRYSFAKNRSI